MTFYELFMVMASIVGTAAIALTVYVSCRVRALRKTRAGSGVRVTIHEGSGSVSDVTVEVTQRPQNQVKRVISYTPTSRFRRSHRGDKQPAH